MSDESKRTWLTHPGKPGVIYREHPTRKIARKPDRFWAIRHRAGGKRLIETLGWTSEGWTADMAHALLVELQHNAKLGLRPQTLKEKREMAAGAKAEAARQSALEGLKEITFGELAGFYREWAAANRRSGAGVARILDRHILPELGEKRAADITPATVNELKALLEAKRPERGRGQNDPDARLSPQTVLHCLKTVREVYNYALETPHPDMPERMLYVGKNPAILSRRGRGVRVPVSDARRLRILTDAEIAQLLAYEGQHKAFAAELRDMILLSLDTGVRSGELIRLRREDVDTERGTLRILSGSDFGLTKSGRTRIVHAGYLFPEARDVLRRHARGDSPYLFPGRDGGVRDGTALGRAMNRMAETLGLNSGVTDPRNRVVWHTLRHTFATRMLESGVDIYTLKELLGHSSVAVTEGYLHLCDRAKREKALARITLERAVTFRGHQ